MSYLVFDLETVPDYTLYAPPELPAAQKTDHPIAPSYAQIPIAIGVLWLGDDYGFKRLGIVGEDRKEVDERSMLQDFVSFIDRHKPLLVTYNGRTFDMPVIALRSLHHGLSLPWYYKAQGYRYRYSDEGHLDLCDYLAEHGASRYIGLDTAARLIGLPGKGGVDGSQVEALFRSGQIESIRRYCLSDVVQTGFLLLRFRLLQGKMTSEEYHAAVEALFTTLQGDARVKDLLAGTDRKRLLLNAI